MRIGPSPLRLSAPIIAAAGFFLLCLIFLWVFGDVLLPFILGAVIAYLLDPVIGLLTQQTRMRRPVAVLLILFSFLFVIALGLSLTIPLLVRETSQFIQDAPTMFDQLVDYTMPFMDSLRERLGLTDEIGIKQIVTENWQGALTAGGTLTEIFTAIGGGITAFVTVCIFTVIIAYFMLNEWPEISRWIKGMIPRPLCGTAYQLWDQIDAKLAGFVRGQLTVALILGISYAVALSIAGLNYGVLIGLLSGLLAIIPMVGSTVGLVASVLVALVQSGDLFYVAVIAAIFLSGQMIEGNFLTPMIVGDKVGLHPLWVFFALLAGGSLMGITGMLIAVPVAAVISVLLSFAIREYKDSAYYKGEENILGPDDPILQAQNSTPSPLQRA